MKRYGNSRFNHDKYRAQQRHNEHRSGGFKCTHCKQFVIINNIMGMANRNHCNVCLWSKHVDDLTGDRCATCQGGMEPIGLTFKNEGYGKVGEVMLIHLCSVCQKISINRVARDDPEYKILEIYNESLGLCEPIKAQLDQDKIHLLTEDDRQELSTRLFGK